MKPEKFKFDHVHIKCRDIKKAKRFYEEMFDAKTFFEGEIRNAPFIMMELGGAYINLSGTTEGEILERSNKPRENVWIRYGIGHFGIRVKDLEKAAQQLRNKGAEFVWEPRDIREGVRAAFIKGPEDDVIEIVERS